MVYYYVNDKPILLVRTPMVTSVDSDPDVGDPPPPPFSLETTTPCSFKYPTSTVLPGVVYMRSVDNTHSKYSGEKIRDGYGVFLSVWCFVPRLRTYIRDGECLGTGPNTVAR